MPKLFRLGAKNVFLLIVVTKQFFSLLGISKLGLAKFVRFKLKTGEGKPKALSFGSGIFFQTPKIYVKVGGSPGLLVMGGDSCPEGRGSNPSTVY